MDGDAYRTESLSKALEEAGTHLRSDSTLAREYITGTCNSFWNEERVVEELLFHDWLYGTSSFQKMCDDMLPKRVGRQLRPRVFSWDVTWKIMRRSVIPLLKIQALLVAQRTPVSHARIERRP
jgi:hypothetical protein